MEASVFIDDLDAGLSVTNWTVRGLRFSARAFFIFLLLYHLHSLLLPSFPSFHTVHDKLPKGPILDTLHHGALVLVRQPHGGDHHKADS